MTDRDETDKNAMETADSPLRTNVPLEVPPGMSLADALKLSTKVIKDGILIEDVTGSRHGFGLMPGTVPSKKPKDKQP
jgi:hypothetical protein